MCVTSHIRERGGEVNEPGETADEVKAHEGVLDGMDSSEHRPWLPGPGHWAKGQRTW